MHGEEQKLKHKAMAVPSCYVPVFLKKKHSNARKAVWFTEATVIGAISALVDSIDSHIILRMIRESKRKLFTVPILKISIYLSVTVSI